MCVAAIHFTQCICTAAAAAASADDDDISFTRSRLCYLRDYFVRVLSLCPCTEWTVGSEQWTSMP